MIRLLAALLALFAAIALFVAAADAFVDVRHSRWQVADAVVKQEDIRVEYPFPSSGGGTVYSLSLAVLTPDGNTRRVAISPEGSTAPLDAWVARHQAGSRVPVRIDPDNARNAELVDRDGLMTPRHVREDLILFAAPAAASAALFAIAAIRSRRARSRDRSPASAR